MTNLTPDQQDRVKRLRQSRQDLIAKREELYEDGAVEQNLSNFFSGLAGNHQSVGVFATYHSDLDIAQEAFAAATTYYQRSAEEDAFPLHSTRQRMQGMYTALLAGLKTELVGIAESLHTLADSTECSPGDQHDDRFFLAWCLAGAVTGDISEDALEGLKTVNESKPGAHAHYGQAVISVARGLQDGESSALVAGVESMLSFHEQDMSSDNVSDCIMSVPATALLVLARARGYDIAVESPFIPDALVEQAVASVAL